MLNRHRLLLGGLLIGNAFAFAGVDDITRLATAALVLLLLVDARSPPPIEPWHRRAAVALGVLVIVQLVPLPEPVRRLLQPGLVDYYHAGWAPLSVAPWATVRVAASAVVAVGVALASSRAAATRTGLPEVLGLVAAVCAVLGVLGFAGEAGLPDEVMLLRPNTGGGDAYGPFVNSNHFALAVELTLPAAMVLLAVAARHLRERRLERQRSVVIFLGALVICAIGCAAMIRSGSRAGMLFLAAAALLSTPLWRRAHSSGRSWPLVPIVVAVVAAAVVLASTQLAVVRDEFSSLLVIEGVEGNSRWDIWQGTVRMWQRAPIAGVGLGSYRHVIGIDKPATGSSRLEQAHNDWLEWLATGGVVGAAILLAAVIGVIRMLRPSAVRRMRFEYRYPLAGAAVAAAATMLHETVGFGLQTPLNRYLLAVWIGLMWGLSRSEAREGGAEDDG